MTNRTPRNHNKQQPDERPFAYILKRALLQQHQHDRNIDTVQRRSTTPKYQITIEHGSIWLGQECAANTR